jgi:GNAT superfamily N-acetyltransferase
VSRIPVALREAEAADAADLASIWTDIMRRAEQVDLEADMVKIIQTVANRPDRRIVVAECDGVVAGAVYLKSGPMTPLNLDPLVYAISPHVLPEYRRRGIGRALMEAAAGFAEELGVTHVASASSSGSRDANRFLARLGLSPQAILRFAPTQTLRARLSAQAPSQTTSARRLGQLLAARRRARGRGSMPEDVPIHTSGQAQK